MSGNLVETYSNDNQDCTTLFTGPGDDEHVALGNGFRHLEGFFTRVVVYTFSRIVYVITKTNGQSGS